MVGQGLAYSAFAAVIWPSVPLVVEKKLIGLGYGTITSVQNAGLASFPLVVATIYQKSGDEYIPDCEFFFVSLAVLGVLVGIFLNVYDVNHDNIFNSPTRPIDDILAYDTLLMEEDDTGGQSRQSHKSGSFSAHEEVYRARIKSR